MLRSRASRREEELDEAAAGGRSVAAPTGTIGATDPEQEAVLADTVGLAMVVVLDTLTPAERVAFVLHDMFAVPFDDVATILERSPEAVRQLASRARRRVQGTPAVPDADLTRRRDIVDRFLAAARGGDFAGLMAVLAPDVVFRDKGSAFTGPPREVHGAEAIAGEFVGRANAARSALVEGAVGIVVAPGGRLLLVLEVAFAGDTISEIEVIADPDRLSAIQLAVLDA
jgi:RNA polymerase sigma-70 factor (ECF subfamily)